MTMIDNNNNNRLPSPTAEPLALQMAAKREMNKARKHEQRNS